MSKDSPAKYYLDNTMKHLHDNTERLQKMTRERNQSFQRRNRKKQQYGIERHKNIAEDEKRRLFEY